MLLKFMVLWLAAALAVPAQAAPAMWRVHDADTEVILFGTIHELPVTAVWQTPRILEAFDAADTLVVEVDIPDDPFVVARAVEAMGIQSGLPLLIDRVPKDRRATLLKAVAGFEVPAGERAEPIQIGRRTLNGGGGNDTLNGGLGNDVLTGGAGANRLDASGFVTVGADTLLLLINRGQGLQLADVHLGQEGGAGIGQRFAERQCFGAGLLAGAAWLRS